MRGAALLEHRPVDSLRWEQFTGGQARLEGDGRTFAEVSAARLAKAA